MQLLGRMEGGGLQGDEITMKSVLGRRRTSLFFFVGGGGREAWNMWSAIAMVLILLVSSSYCGRIVVLSLLLVASFHQCQSGVINCYYFG